MKDGIINMKTHMFIIINLLTTLMFFTSCKQDAEESFFFKIRNWIIRMACRGRRRTTGIYS